MARPWEADNRAAFQRRLGKTAAELGDSRTTQDCPEIWALENGDIAVIGRDATAAYMDNLPRGVRIGSDERLVVISGACSRRPSRTFGMLEQLREIPGEQLDHAAYHADYAREIKDLRGVIWKLERAQYFREPGDKSWEAFIAGDWRRSLDLLEADRAAVRAEARSNAEVGLQIRRIRVVEQPVSPYLQWELHALRMVAQEGFGVRILAAGRIQPLEREGRLPEVVIIGDRVLYQVSYEPDLTPCGARRSHDPDVIRLATAEIAEMYGLGEPLLDFFEREIAPLPKPTV